MIKFFLHDDRKVHGLTDKIMFDKILNSGVELLFTPDSSSSDFKQHKILREHNIYHIALDHHPFIPQEIPSVIVNNQVSDRVTNKCGSGERTPKHNVHSALRDRSKSDKLLAILCELC